MFHLSPCARSWYEESGLERLRDAPFEKLSVDVVAEEGVVATDAGDLGGWKRWALRPWTGEKMDC